VGVTDINEQSGKARAEELGVPFFDDHRALLRETKPDVAVVITPHPFHAEISIDALNAGAHVLVEKPIAVRVAEADAMIEAARCNDRILAVNYQHRCRGDIRAIKKLIDNGRLGQVQHFDMVAAWPRTATYYAGGGWRGTWKGEGGGVLMNQAPHNLDLVCHLMGQPTVVFAWTRTNLHKIETEDTVHAICEWENGAQGSIHVSTAEAGRPERLEIVGTAGFVQILDGALSWKVLDPDFADVARSSPEALPEIIATPAELAREAGEGNHLDIYRNFHDAILNGVPLVADGVEGLMSLELANAMIQSGQTSKPVSLPVDRAGYDTVFARLVGAAGA
jgi:predicted dehydrogenase